MTERWGKKMDIATGCIAKEMMRLADKINREEYGSDIDFDNKKFLEELHTKIVEPLHGEIYIDD